MYVAHICAQALATSLPRAARSAPLPAGPPLAGRGAPSVPCRV